MRYALLTCCLGVLCLNARAEDEFRVYTEHPRLFLRPQRLRLLKRERERQSLRWRQFEALIRGGAAMPEPGFALALYAAVAGDAAAAGKAVEWALKPGAGLRQAALVYDWTQDWLAPAQSAALAAKIAALAARPPGADLGARRDQALAAIALADGHNHPEEPVLRETVEKWFRGRYAPSLLDGGAAPTLSDTYALLEMLHAVRDNLNLDLREAAGAYFKALPGYQVLANYPAPYQAAENEFRIPVYAGAGQPDLDRAALARAAGLSMVAYEANAQATQFLQGWLIQDRFLMRGVFGAPYEFLWANPYQPGLSYFHLPLLFHDAASGALFVRSSWEEDAVWFGIFGGEEQLFRDGRVTVLNRQATAPADAQPIQIGTASLLAASGRARFPIGNETLFVVGLKPRRPYLVEVDDEELDEIPADAAGTLTLHFPPDRTGEVRIEEAAK